MPAGLISIFVKLAAAKNRLFPPRISGTCQRWDAPGVDESESSKLAYSAEKPFLDRPTFAVRIDHVAVEGIGVRRVEKNVTLQLAKTGVPQAIALRGRPPRGPSSNRLALGVGVRLRAFGSRNRTSHATTVLI